MVANYLVSVKNIVPDDVPSSGALSILSWVKLSSSNFGDFLRSNYTKIIPDKRELEHVARYKDTGQDLKLIEDFMRQLEAEQSEDERLFAEWKRNAQTAGSRSIEQWE